MKCYCTCAVSIVHCCPIFHSSRVFKCDLYNPQAGFSAPKDISCWAVVERIGSSGEELSDITHKRLFRRELEFLFILCLMFSGNVHVLRRCMPIVCHVWGSESCVLCYVALGSLCKIGFCSAFALNPLPSSFPVTALQPGLFALLRSPETLQVRQPKWFVWLPGQLRVTIHCMSSAAGRCFTNQLWEKHKHNKLTPEWDNECSWRENYE